MDWSAIGGGGVRVEHQVPLSRYTTFQLGGPCRTLIHCDSPEQVRRVLPALAASEAPLVWMGGGSNLLVSDDGFDGIVLRYAATRPSVRVVGDEVSADAGVDLDALVRATVDAGLDGLVCCSGIPGSVGGAVVGNAGAWGRQIGDCLIEVAAVDPSGTESVWPAERLRFAYRSSALQQEPAVVLEARFRLMPADPEALMHRRTEILAVRAEKHPDLTRTPCIGSIFRNIEPTSAAGRRQAAGWFLEQAGAKSMRVGGARVFDKHANIIVKDAGCSAQDVRDLAQLMADAVENNFGFRLVREVRYLGRFDGEDPAPGDGFY